MPVRSLISIFALAAVLLGSDADARADAMPPLPRCTAAPNDGAGCGSSPVGRVCRYPRVGVACTCTEVRVGRARRRTWQCGELGE